MSVSKDKVEDCVLISDNLSKLCSNLQRLSIVVNNLSGNKSTNHDTQHRDGIDATRKSLSEQEQRQRGISYLKWLLSIHTRVDTIKKKAHQIFDSEENHPTEVMAALQEIQELSNEEFRSLFVSTLEANNHLPGELMTLFDPEDKNKNSFSSVVQKSWTQWTLHTSDPSSPAPSLYILIRDISPFLICNKTLQDHYLADYEATNEDKSNANIQDVKLSFQHAVTIVQEASMIDQAIIAIIGSEASHRETNIGKLFYHIAAPIEVIVDSKFTEETILQRKDISETRNQFPRFLKKLGKLYQQIWLTYSSLFHPGNRAKIQNRSNTELTNLEFLYGSEFTKLVAHKLVKKNSRIFPGIENKTVMKTIGTFWSKSDSHLTLTLQTFALHTSKAFTITSLNMYFKLLQQLSQFYGDPTGFLYPLFYHYLNRSRRKPQKLYAMLKEHQAIQYVADLYSNMIIPSVTPDSTLWKQFSASIWEIDEEQIVFSRLVDALNQLCLVLIGSAGSVVDSLASFIIAMISQGGNKQCFRSVVSKLSEHLEEKTSFVSGTNFNMIQRLSVELFDCIGEGGKTLNTKLLEFTKTSTFAAPVQTSNSKMSMMELIGAPPLGTFCMETEAILLFDYPLSFYGSVIRLCLIEKQIPFQTKRIDIGPRLQNYLPSYMKLNSRGVVPTLQHGDNIVTDCFRIMYYIEQNFAGSQELHFLDDSPASSCRLLDDLLLQLYSFPIRELTTSRQYTGLFGWLLNSWIHFSFTYRKSALKYYSKRYPSLSSDYELRIEDLEEWKQTITSRTQRRIMEERMQRLIDGLECILAQNQREDTSSEWIISSKYTLIDVLWTVYLSRLQCIKMHNLWHDSKHRHVQEYIQRVQQRPSFKQAGLWTSLHKKKMIFLFLRSSIWIIVKYLLLATIVCGIFYVVYYYVQMGSIRRIA